MADELIRPGDSPEDRIVAEYNRLQQEYLDDMDALIERHYGVQERRLVGRERALKQMLRDVFIGGLAWGPAVGAGRKFRLQMSAGRIASVKARTFREIGRWRSATVQDLLGGIARDPTVVAGIPLRRHDALLQAIHGNTREHYRQLDRFSGKDFWRRRGRLLRERRLDAAAAGASKQSIESHSYGRYSNVLAFIDTETRKVREGVVNYTARSTSKEQAGRWVEEIRFNRGNFRLCENTHGLSLSRWSVQRKYPPGQFRYRLDVPSAKFGRMRMKGAIAGGLWQVRDAAGWEKYNAGIATGSSDGVFGLGFHHNDFSHVSPIPTGDEKLLAAFMADATRRRSEFNALVRTLEGRPSAAHEEAA